jgi:hypothetical protein
LWALVICPMASLAQDEWDAALRSIPRLVPGEIDGLSPPIVARLEDRGCTVPQTYFPSGNQNVIAGHFISADRMEWAVLCSVADSSEIVLFDEGGEQLHAFQQGPDRQWLQGIGGGQIGYSRLLRVVHRADALARTANLNGEVPPIERDAIEEIFTEKASVLWYWHDGAWLELPGVD